MSFRPGIGARRERRWRRPGSDIWGKGLGYLGRRSGISGRGGDGDGEGGGGGWGYLGRSKTTHLALHKCEYLPELGVIAGPDDDASSTTVTHQGPHEGNVGQLGQVSLCTEDGGGLLELGARLARKRGLVKL